jgi:hypothetical protein
LKREQCPCLFEREDVKRIACAGGAALEAPNEPVRLTVSYSYTRLPIPAFSPSSPLSSTEASLAD